MSSEQEFPDFGNMLDFAGMAAEQNEKHRKETTNLLLAFLEIVDSLEAFAQHCEELVSAGQNQVPARTANTIVGQARNVLRQMNVEPMEAVGRPLNLEWHDVHSVSENSAAEPDTVLEEKVRGYLWKGSLLRRAKVVIAS
jgi:molecular chaperone GrpE